MTNTPTEASDEEVAKMLDQILGQRAEYNVAEKAAEKGDYVQCAYEGKSILKSLPISCLSEPYVWFSNQHMGEEAGNEDAPGVRAIVDGLVGMKAGETKEVTMEFPQDFEARSPRRKNCCL